MNQTTKRLESAREFILREARLLERRLFAALFEGAPVAGVLDALRGYQNDDGGFGHGLEPDKLCPASQPIDVSLALQTMDAVGSADESMLRSACAFLAKVSRGGCVPLAFPSIEGFPRARHWNERCYAYGISPTAGIAGLLHRFGARHAWLEAATAYCWSSIERSLPDEAHALAAVLGFLEPAESQRVEGLAAKLGAHLPTVTWLRLDPKDPAYGVTPLHFAPTPRSRWRSLFDDGVIEGHLDRLEADQAADGGWTLTWEPPSDASRLAWRGMETLRALRVLNAYGRLDVPTSGAKLVS